MSGVSHSNCRTCAHALGQATRLTLKPLDEADLKRLIEQVAGEHESHSGNAAPADYLLSRHRPQSCTNCKTDRDVGTQGVE